MQCLRRMKIWAKKKAHRIDHKPMRLLCWLIVGIVLVFGLVVALTKKCDWGETGYAAFGSLFSALAFAGMIVTVLLQRSELQEQRKELRAQRHELEGQKKELEVQNRTAQLQRFENSFFHLLDNFTKTVTELRIENRFQGSRKHIHYNVAIYFEEEIKKRGNNFIRFGRKGTITDIHYTFNHLPFCCKKFLHEYYLIVHFILNHAAFEKDNSHINDYISILNTTLYNSEYIFLFYDGIIHDDRRHLINKYKLFSNYILQHTEFRPCAHWHILFFSSSAFGSGYGKYIKDYNLEGKTLADYLPEESSLSNI